MVGKSFPKGSDRHHRQLKHETYQSNHSFDSILLSIMLDVQSLQDSLPTLEPSSETPSPLDKVTHSSRALTDRLFADWHELNTIVQSHEHLIRKRWRKKTRDQKKAVLEEAWGHDLSESHRPDLTLYMDDSNQESPQSLDAYKWPFINLEDLLQPRMLPMFLSSRGRHHPYSFCHADLTACGLGLSAGKIDKLVMKDYNMAFSRVNASEGYGRIVAAEDAADSSDDGTTGFRLKLGEGLLVLELQQRIWKFLLACAKEITHDVAAESTEATTLDSESHSVPASESAHTTLAASFLEAPYREPAHLNIDRIKSIAAAKRSGIADHIWLLREDPSYFADCVTEWKDHQPEMLLDAEGKKHPIHKTGLTKAFWNRVLRKMITDSYLSLSLWESTYQEVCKLDHLLQKHPDPSPSQNLPEELAFAIKKVRHLLELSSANSIALLKSHVPPSPPMLNYWHREGTSTADHHSSKFRTDLNTRTDQDPALNRLFWAYTILWDEKQSAVIGLHTLVAELDRLTYADTKAKELQSALVVDNIADLGVISECLNQLSLFYPWSRDIEHEMARNRQHLAEDFYAKSAEWDNFRKMPWQGVDLAELGSPENGRFSYPIANRRTKTNAGALHKAEERLDSFWYEVDKHLAAQSVTLPDKIMRLILSGNRFLQRTPEWDEPPPKSEGNANGKLNNRANGKMNGKSNGKSNKSNGKMNDKSNEKANGKPVPKQPDIDPFYVPLSQTYLQLSPSHKRASSMHEPAKSKPKDSDVMASGLAASKANTTTTTTPSEKLTFAVDKRAKKTFSALFFTPSSNDTPADTTWTDFVHAMHSIGFVVEKLFGSIWQFTPPERMVGESIQFHAPLHADKIHYHMARLYGRRLGRAYGWTGDMFVLQ